MAIDAILFDKDGVLVDFDRTWKPALKSFAAKLANGHPEETERYLVAAGFDPNSDQFLAGSVWAAGHTIDLVRVWDPNGDEASHKALTVSIEEHCLTIKPASILPLDALQDLFAGLRRRQLKLGIATNDIERSALKTVAQFGIGDYLDLVLGYDSVANPKPAPDPIYRFCEHTGVEPANIAMVGDNLHDMEMARAAGTGVAIAVLSGNSSYADLAPHADYIIESIAQLPVVLAEFSGQPS